MPRPLAGLLAVPEDSRLVQALFLKGLALIYLAAFASLGVQIVGLVGESGILPLAEQQAYDAATLGIDRFRLKPSLFWIDASDAALLAAAWGGVGLSALVFMGIWRRACLIGMFVLYLSLHQAGSAFLSFQWDALLLEAGFLAIFMTNGGTRLGIWLMRWLLFRLRFLSGISKLLSGDPMWSGLGALSAYFETQPLPHVGAWYAHQLPETVLRAATAATLVVEIAVPFLFLAPRRWRFVGAWITIVFQILILATSNHTFFNPLTLLLCLFLFDDRALTRVVPAGLRRRLVRGGTRPGRAEGLVLLLLAVPILVTSLAQAARLAVSATPPAWIGHLADQVRALRISNAYHVFPTMKPKRIEILLEATWDGETWAPVRFRYKPGNPMDAPAFIVPHHPRLDWLLWFTPSGSPVFFTPYARLVERLRAAIPEVVALLDDDRFADGPPRDLRGSLWHYRFTDRETRRRTGAWWTLEWIGPYHPAPMGQSPQ